MENLYHLSHFFEFLCGLYFGGTAILGFIEASLIKRFYMPLKQKQDDVENVRVMAKQYVQVVVNKSLKDLRVNDIYIMWAYFAFKVADKIFFRFFNFLTSLLVNLNLSRKDVLLKKFFPSFLFNGIVCLLIVLLSGFQETNDIPQCKQAINLFLINIGLSAILYQLIALFVIPRMVNIVNYLHIMVMTLLLVVALIIMSAVLSNYNYAFNLDYILQPKERAWLQLDFVIISLFPLLSIIFFGCLILIFWEATTLFYGMSNIIFISRVSNVVSKDIQDIQEV